MSFDGGDGCGHRKARERVIIHKRTCADVLQLAAFSDIHLCQVGAAPECVILDAGDGVGERDGAQFGCKVEGLGADDFHAGRNREGRARLTDGIRYEHGSILGVKCAVQRAIILIFLGYDNGFKAFAA